MTAMRESGGAGPIIINYAPFPEAPRASRCESAFSDLEIEALFRALHRCVPGDGFWCRDYIRKELENPLYDRAAIGLRQDAIEELLDNNELFKTVAAVKAACERFKYRRVYNGGMEGGRTAWRDSLQRMENAAQLAELGAALVSMGHPVSSRLDGLRRFCELLESDAGFRQVRRFVDEVYLPRRLGDALYEVLKSAEQERARSAGTGKDQEDGARIVIESAEVIISENYLDIHKKTGTVRRLRNALGRSRARSGRSRLSRADRKGMAHALAECLVEILAGLIYERIPAAHPGDMDMELALYLGAAALCRRWIAQGIHVAKPAVIEPGERRCDIRNGHNTTLLAEHAAESVPNDVCWDGNQNLFVITGPNNGGKTTYLRMAGQLLWMIHVGLLIPAKSAAASMIDGFFTSFTGGDDSLRGEGHYAAELSRIARFLLPGGAPAGPWSLVLLDEFAIGTDQEEAARITGVVLSHLSDKGVTTFFTTHRREAAELVESGGLPGGVNLAMEVTFKGESPAFTYRMRRNAREGSYGHLQAERIGITPARLRAALDEEIRQGRYPASHTRVRGSSTDDAAR
jgi:hypothetical protein